MIIVRNGNSDSDAASHNGCGSFALKRISELSIHLKPNNLKFVTSSSSKRDASCIEIVSVSSTDLWTWNYQIWKYRALVASSLIEVMLMNMKYKNEWVVKTSYLIICQINQRERLLIISLRTLYYGTYMLNILEIRTFSSYLT